MYTEDDLQSAVASGALSAEAAAALRAHVGQLRDAPLGDEEQFRLVNSFNDIFVTIAAVLLMVAMAGIGAAITRGFEGPPPFSGLLVAGSAWMMAEFFTRRRRMALPSIVLLVAFVGGVFEMLIGLLAISLTHPDEMPRMVAVLGSGAALFTAGAALLHWRRFHVPITIAAGTAALVGMAIALILAAIGPDNVTSPETVLIPLVFIAGLVVFGFAMWWDGSDRTRQTRRSDVAFWLHLLAAPMIAHPLFYWLGVTGGHNIGGAAAVGVLLAYIAMGLVALAVDRRALLVSALAYVLVALTWLFDKFGAVELNVALTALVIGSALLMLSAFWSTIRSALVAQLPGTLQARLPVAGALPA
ncbi:MAG: hypothetical protein IE933_03905 [Sphingomonadales bacterium]|nr:hypothetical protein [Sphingomonadales bacterium]MBD3772562.1 hypothetical protein [Paracoccaceae bacterium]